MQRTFRRTAAYRTLALLCALGAALSACRQESSPGGEAAPVPERIEAARDLAAELPERLDDDVVPFLAWVHDELLETAGKKQAEVILWTIPNPGSNTEDLGKLWLALESIGVPPDRKALFRRAERTLDTLPDVDFVPITGGSFLMGAPETERGRTDAEAPQREVRVAAFEIASVPVTNEQFERFDPLHAREEQEGLSIDDLDDHPVVNVSWWDAFVFSRWLGARLPSEAEWEYACRAGTTTRFWSGDGSDDLAEAGWFFDNAERRTHAVGSKAANPWGLFDMHGNVFEWVRDAWHDDYSGAPASGAPWLLPPSSMHVYRGGAWNRYAEYARSAFRGGWLASERNGYLGFRVARDATN